MISRQQLISFFKLFYRGFGDYKKQIGILALLGFFSSLLGGIGITALIPLFSFITTQGSNGTDIISRTIKEIFLFLGVPLSVRYLLILISLLFILKAIMVLWSNYISAKIGAEYQETTRNNLYRSMLKAGWPYLLKQKIGHLETVLMTNVKNCALLLGYISSIVITISSIIVYAFVAINISVRITLITLIFSIIAFFILQPLIHRLRRISYEEEKTNRDIAHHINENIVGLKTIKATLVDNQIIQVAENYFKKLKKITIKSSLLASLGGGFMEPVSLIFIIVVFAFSYKTPNFNIIAFAAVIYLIKQIFSYTQQLQSYFLILNNLIPYLKNVLILQEQAVENKEIDAGFSSFEFKNSLEFKNVAFLYDGKKNILSGMNFEIKKGELIGLIGPSGAGKTTIVDLILRLFQPTSGEISVDAVNINSIKLSAWRQNIGYVSQDIFLKNDTIANNIRFYDETISETEIEEAAKMANIYDFIIECPDKFETIVGERGVVLSAGQRQRIVMARVLVRKPQILILDEATSALDNESEMQIQKVIENLKNKVTVLVIAHRLSTIINVDRLLVLADGRILEEGRPRELLTDNDSYFYKVYNIKK